MLTINADQMNGLRRSALASTFGKFASLLRKKLPIQTSNLSDEALALFCDGEILAAAAFEIKTEYNNYVFIAARLVFGEELGSSAKSSWTREILNDRTMHEDLKASLLIQRTLILTGMDIAPHGR